MGIIKTAIITILILACIVFAWNNGFQVAEDIINNEVITRVEERTTTESNCYWINNTGATTTINSLEDLKDSEKFDYICEKTTQEKLNECWWAYDVISNERETYLKRLLKLQKEYY